MWEQKKGWIVIAVIKTYSVEIQEEILFNVIGINDPLRANEAIVSKVREMIVLATTLAKPQVIYEEVEFTVVDEQNLLLADGQMFTSRYVVKKMTECESILVLAMSLGGELHEQVSELSAKDPFCGYVIDGISAYMVETLSDLVWQDRKAAYLKRGKNISIYYAPGVHDFGLENQQVVFDVLKPEQIGIYLNESYLMVPMKSLSGIIGIGEKVIPVNLGHDCAECDREQCFLREASSC